MPVQRRRIEMPIPSCYAFQSVVEYTPATELLLLIYNFVKFAQEHYSAALFRREACISDRPVTIVNSNEESRMYVNKCW